MSDFFSNIITIFIIYLIISSLFGKKDKNKKEEKNNESFNTNIDIHTDEPKSHDTILKQIEEDKYSTSNKKYIAKKVYKSHNYNNDMSFYTDNNKNNENYTNTNKNFFTANELKKAIIYSEILNKPKFKKYLR
jgi:hypothetical protein